MKVVAAVGVLVTLARSASAEDTQPYVVQPGDSCLGIALRILGERRAVADLHRLNPQLGALPHDLAVGSVLTIPARRAAAPDARVTRVRGDVKVRKPSSDAWNVAERGTDLFRAYRVGAATAASAELTFDDAAVLGMRERTIVVIYGPEKHRAKLISATADLETGTLETRLQELDGKPLVVRTAAAEADLRAGDVVVTATDAGPSTVSNHRGAPIEVRSRTKKRSAVKVTAGMGSRVAPGKPPEPPRPLPAAPAWTTASGPRILATGGTIAVAWGAVARAVTYRIAIHDATGDLVASQILPATVTTAALPLAPGPNRIVIAAFDADAFESAPSRPLELDVISLSFVAPVGAQPAPGAAARTLALGTAVTAPERIACTIGGPASQRVVLDRPGRAYLSCVTTSGQLTDALALDIVDLSPPRAVVPVPSFAARSVVAPPRRPWSVELGAYTGFHSVGSGALDDGPTGGVRLGFGRSGYGVESELGLSSLGRVDATATTSVTTVRTHLTLRHDDGAVSLLLLAGLGLTIDDEVRRGSAAWGGAAMIRVRGVHLRADVRHELGPDGRDGSLSHGLLALVGVSLDLTR